MTRERMGLLAGLRPGCRAGLGLAVGGDSGLVRGVEIAELSGDASELLRRWSGRAGGDLRLGHVRLLESFQQS